MTLVDRIESSFCVVYYSMVLYSFSELLVLTTETLLHLTEVRRRETFSGDSSFVEIR